MATDTSSPTQHDRAARVGTSPASDGSAESEGKNVLEWSMVLLGAAIVLFTFGYLTYKVFSGADDPADLRVTLGAPETRGDFVLVPVEVTNKGGLVAQEATIEVCAGTAECAQLDFPFVPHQSVHHGQIGFNTPLAGPLRARVMSYRE